jgi:hypothetical protein
MRGVVIIKAMIPTNIAPSKVLKNVFLNNFVEAEKA